MDLGRHFSTIWQFLSGWVLDIANRISIFDVVDMLIIAFLLYKLMRFLRKSRLGLAAKSILFFVAVVWVAGRLNLTVIHFASSRAMEMGILALVILFQPEIRQTFERLGRNNIIGFFNKGPGEGMDTVVAQVIIACQQMVKEKTGALIVFERKVSLEDEAKTGTRIDARVSAELLVNIFFDKAPLHDGALLIRNGRVGNAGCMLPLSDNTSLSRELGMRHRAGIGVSEKSDAVAVVVSEETGTISVAVDGNLRRHLALDTFENLLKNELLTEEAPKVSVLTSVLIKLLGGKKNAKHGE